MLAHDAACVGTASLHASTQSMWRGVVIQAALVSRLVQVPEAEEARMAQAAESLRDMGVEVPEGEEKLDSFC